MAEKYDYEQPGQGRPTNDALIAMSAGRLGILVLTANERACRRLAEFPAFQRQDHRLGQHRQRALVFTVPVVADNSK